MTHSAAHSPLINQIKDIESLLLRSTSVIWVSSVGSPPHPRHLSCRCKTHVTLIKRHRYCRNASCGDVIGRVGVTVLGGLTSVETVHIRP